MNNSNGTLTVYMGDLVHTWKKTIVWMMPLNIGLIAAYALKKLGDRINIRLFKCPTEMIAAIKEAPPDVVALSHYVWNTNLNRKVFLVAKQCNPETLTVGGGPIFTTHNLEKSTVERFFVSHKNCDA
jgi:hypothetical protein